MARAPRASTKPTADPRARTRPTAPTRDARTGTGALPGSGTGTAASAVAGTTDDSHASGLEHRHGALHGRRASRGGDNKAYARMSVWQHKEAAGAEIHHLLLDFVPSVEPTASPTACVLTLAPAAPKATRVAHTGNFHPPTIPNFISRIITPIKES